MAFSLVLNFPNLIKVSVEPIIGSLNNSPNFPVSLELAINTL
jgi:hypothetical protein